MTLIITAALLLSIAPTAFAAETKSFDIPLWKADYSPNNTFTISNVYDFTDFDWNEAGYVVDTDLTITVNMPVNVFLTAAGEDGYSEAPIKDAEFEEYNIYDNNYFKLRDVALALIGTEKQFEVTWDGENEIINLISNKAYTRVGGEIELGDGTQKSCQHYRCQPQACPRKQKSVLKQAIQH